MILPILYPRKEKHHPLPSVFPATGLFLYCLHFAHRSPSFFKNQTPTILHPNTKKGEVTCNFTPNHKNPAHWDPSSCEPRISRAPGWLGRLYRGWNTTQWYRDYFINPEIMIPSLTNQYFMESKSAFFSWLMCIPSDFFLKDVQRLALDRFGCDHLPVLGRGLLPCRCGGQSKGMDP